MAACNWYGPTEPLGNVAERSAIPSAICCLIPERPVLLRQRDQLAFGACSRQTASIGQQHEREQSSHLRVVRLQIVDDPRQAHCLMREIASAQLASDAARVALIEDEVKDVENGAAGVALAPQESAVGMECRSS